MHEEPLNPYRTFEYDEKVRATFYNYDSMGSDEEWVGIGRRFVAVEIGRATPDAAKPTGTVFTDLSRLEAVADRVHEILQNPNGLGASFATEKVAGQEVTFLAWPTRGKTESLTINLEDVGENGRITATVSLEQLEAILEDGLTVERELKYDQAECHTLVSTESIKRNPETGKIEAKVKECFEEAIDAQLYMHKGSFTALLPPTKRPPTGGVVEIPPGTILQMCRGGSKTVDELLETRRMHLERKSEDFVVVKWQYNAPPTIGLGVKVIGVGFEDSNGAFQDFKAHPYSVKHPTRAKEEFYALVKLNPENSSLGEVVGFSRIRQDMVELLKTAQRDLDISRGVEQQQNHAEDVSRRLLQDLSKQSFSPHLRRL